jgi:anti-sigma factor RsiW
MNERDRQDEHDLAAWRRYGPQAAGGVPGECPDELDLAAWLDGRAGPELADRIEAHLADCPACLAAAADLRAILAASPMLAPRQAIERAKALGRARLRRHAGLWARAGRWAAVAATGVLVSYAGLAIGAGASRSRQAVQAAVVGEATLGLENGVHDDGVDGQEIVGESIEDVLLALTEVQP